jgi:Rieske Fe-S protein
MSQENDQSDCTDCPLMDRRAALRRGALGALALLGAPSALHALEAASANLLELTPSRVEGDVRTYAIPMQDGVHIDKDPEVIVVRWEGVLYAFALSCPHQHTPLRWDEGAKHFRCPKHRSQYQPNGSFIKGRATRGMDRLPIRLDGNQLVVTVTPIRQDKDPKGWESAFLKIGEEK